MPTPAVLPKNKRSPSPTTPTTPTPLPTTKRCLRLADGLIGCITIVTVEIISSQQEALHFTSLMSSVFSHSHNIFPCWEIAGWSKKRFEMHSSSSQKTNIRVSTDMQSTNYTIKIQIQNKATVNWSDPQAVKQVSSNIGLSFETVRLNVNHSALILVSQHKNQQTLSYSVWQILVRPVFKQVSQ